MAGEPVIVRLPASADVRPLPLPIVITPPVTVTFLSNLVPYESSVPSTVTLPVTTSPTSVHVAPAGTSRLPAITMSCMRVVHVVVAATAGAADARARTNASPTTFFILSPLAPSFVCVLSGSNVRLQRRQNAVVVARQRNDCCGAISRNPNYISHRADPYPLPSQ